MTTANLAESRAPGTTNSTERGGIPAPPPSIIRRLGHALLSLTASFLLPQMGWAGLCCQNITNFVACPGAPCQMGHPVANCAGQGLDGCGGHFIGGFDCDADNQCTIPQPPPPNPGEFCNVGATTSPVTVFPADRVFTLTGSSCTVAASRLGPFVITPDRAAELVTGTSRMHFQPTPDPNRVLVTITDGLSDIHTPTFILGGLSVDIVGYRLDWQDLSLKPGTGEFQGKLLVVMSTMIGGVAVPDFILNVDVYGILNLSTGRLDVQSYDVWLGGGFWFRSRSWSMGTPSRHDAACFERNMDDVPEVNGAIDLWSVVVVGMTTTTNAGSDVS